MQRGARLRGRASPGFEDGAPFDLLIRRDGAEAEIACDVISAEEGHGVHRGAWFQLVDRIDPELQTWLRAHPGRYLLKLTFPQGLKTRRQAATTTVLPALHARITQMLTDQKRADSDAAAVLRLDPLMLAAAQADELGLMPRLRQEFGPEAHLAVTAAGGGMFVMAARAGAAERGRRRRPPPHGRHRARPAHRHPPRHPGHVHRGHRPRSNGACLRERLELEGEARQFLTNPRGPHRRRRHLHARASNCSASASPTAPRTVNSASATPPTPPPSGRNWRPPCCLDLDRSPEPQAQSIPTHAAGG